ncbi:MAG: molybdopterin-dependent oxidoreductase, partial [Candidatus Eisenbacteria bacterium]|nr:molybdopterin-dependent oxidoreductase [Candidatus Eisenbacteria bacterium]
MEFLLNGAVQRVTTRPGETLLDTLRNRCGIRSIKDGCSPQGQCGCCLVLINGHPRTTCALPTERIQGKEILTLEGLPEEERRWIARSFVAAAGLQCGFCIPGIALRAKVLIDKNPNPTRAEIALALDGHLCRCTGYTKIIDAVELMARARREEFLPEPCADGRVGDPLARYRGEDLVLGQRPYVADLHKPGMLHGAVLLSPHARAKVLKIETSRAEALPGVKAVITAADVPGERWYGLIHNDWPGFVSIGEEVRCVGDILAAVAAIDEATAREARDLIAVEYEVLEPVLDPISAMRDECHRVNPRHANILSRTEIKRGNVEEALKASAHVACGTWETQRIEHLFLETECALAEVRPGGKLTLYTQGQGIFDDRRQVAGFLNIPEDDVFVELVPNGGAFGGKEDISIQTHAALLAWMTQKPVMLALSREESIRIHPKRHPLTLHYTLGCDNEGHFTALKAKIVGDTGAYASV